MSHTRSTPVPSPTPLAEDSTRQLAEIRRRRRLPYVVALALGVLALGLLVALLAPTTSGLTEKLADVCTAAGPRVPADAALDCAQAQRGEVPVRAAGVPGLDGAIVEEPVTVAPVRPGEATTVVYPPGPGAVPGALPSGPVAPGSVAVPGPVVTVTAGPVPEQLAPRETVTVASPPETITGEPGAPVTVRETVTEPAAPPETSTTTVTETVTVTADPGPPPEGPPPGEQPPPVEPSGDPSPAPGSEPAQPEPVVPAVPVSATDGQDEGVLTRLLGFGLGM